MLSCEYFLIVSKFGFGWFISHLGLILLNGRFRIWVIIEHVIDCILIVVCMFLSLLVVLCIFCCVFRVYDMDESSMVRWWHRLSLNILQGGFFEMIYFN